MKFWTWLSLLILLAVAIISCNQNPQVEEEPPLLLEEPDETLASLPPPKGPVADNSRCHVCHINYEDEVLAVVHARANIGCEDCHGESTPHCSDEDNITPPDIMYAREKINPFCLECHPNDKLGDVHKGVLADIATDQTYCTDCHGEHRLGYRTRHWDKATGDLLRDDGVRMIRKEAVEEE